MKTKILIGALLAGAMMSGQAMAADAIETPPAPPEAPVDYTQPGPFWQGGYAGLFAGYGWADREINGVTGDADGWQGGAFLGTNFQTGQFVYGVETDLGYSGADTNIGGINAEQGFNASLRGRVGFAMDPVLVYGTAGVAAARTTFTDGLGNEETQGRIGWTAGAGADVAVTENVFGRLEYRYTDFGDKNVSVGGTTISSGFDEHSVRAGIGLKF